MRAVIGTARYWAPLVAGFLCLIAAQYVGVLVAWLLLFAGFGLIVDGATAMLARAGGAGGRTTASNRSPAPCAGCQPCTSMFLRRLNPLMWSPSPVTLTR